MKKSSRPDIPTFKLTHPSYQPSNAELSEDLRVDATSEEIAKAVTWTVNNVQPRSGAGTAGPYRAHAHLRD